jgi:WbqC-like protein
MKLVGIHQLHYLPWLRYFEKIARCDVFIVLDNIQYTKNGWQNRNRVKTSGGAKLLTVPIFADFGQTLDQVRIRNTVRWREKHWRTLDQNYANAPYFDHYDEFLEQVYAQEWERLNDLNRFMLSFFLKNLGIQTEIVYASELQVDGRATERLIGLVKAVGGNAYYSGAFASDQYLDAARLDEAGIEIILQQWEAPRYPQLHGPFEPDLSIVDLLFNCGPDALAVLRGVHA